MLRLLLDTVFAQRRGRGPAVGRVLDGGCGFER